MFPLNDGWADKRHLCLARDALRARVLNYRQVVTRSMGRLEEEFLKHLKVSLGLFECWFDSGCDEQVLPITEDSVVVLEHMATMLLTDLLVNWSPQARFFRNNYELALVGPLATPCVVRGITWQVKDEELYDARPLSVLFLKTLISDSVAAYQEVASSSSAAVVPRV